MSLNESFVTTLQVKLAYRTMTFTVTLRNFTFCKCFAFATHSSFLADYYKRLIILLIIMGQTSILEFIVFFVKVETSILQWVYLG